MTGLFDGKLPEELEAWLLAALVVVVAVVVALVVHKIAFAVLERVARRTAGVADNALVNRGKGPARLIVVILALLIVDNNLPVTDEVKTAVHSGLTLILTAAVGWLAFSLTRVINDVVDARYDLTVADNLVAREVHTRVNVLQRVLGTVILIVTACLILMAIPGVRQIGITIFASAGIAGIVVGLAARPTLSNLIAGIQLALAQPIRIDDVVIVEGEWGWIEEIRMTFVVVRIWDLRRLVVPLSYFIETPFQNWTRRSADILGTVYLYVDYTVPVAPIREELRRVLEGAELWDGKTWGLQVTNATDRTVELRALMGARNSGDAWNLRCEVREKLIDFLQRTYPDALPRIRAEIAGEPGAAAGPDR
jgi:small-conductance mechanosensitive channel